MSREMANEIVRRRHHFAASRTMEQVRIYLFHTHQMIPFFSLFFLLLTM